MKFKIVLISCAIAIAAIVVACAENTGERCQIDSDCKSGICSMSTGVCVDTNQKDSFDASVPDAPTDAPPDAP